MRQIRGKSLESLEDTTDRKSGTHLTFCRPNNDNNVLYQRCLPSGGSGGVAPQAMIEHLPYLQNKITPWRRSYDDGDITPTNEVSNCCKEQHKFGGGTLPRHRNSSCGLPFPNGGSPNRNRPVAMVHANLILPQAIQQQQQQVMLSSPIDSSCCSNSNNHQMELKMKYSSPIMGKKQPPEPPRRQSSTTTCGGLSTAAVLPSSQLPKHFDGLNLNMSQAIIYQQSIYHQTNNVYNNSNQQPTCFSNYCGHTHQQTTTVEVHAEKSNDSKVRIFFIFLVLIY